MQQFQVTLYNAAGINSDSVVITARDEETAQVAAECTYGPAYVAGDVTKVWPAGTIYGGINASEVTDEDVAYMRRVIASRRVDAGLLAA